MRHRKFGGSTATRTIACPGWHNESDGIPRQNSVFAQAGTALHDCMEQILLDDGIDPQYFAGLTVSGVEITAQMVIDKLWPAYNAFRKLCEDYDVTEFEPEVECSYADDIGGYADLILRGGDTVIVADWKFGDGHQVEAFESPQAKFYGMAAREDSAAKDLFEGATHFTAAIIQPNERGLDDLRTWDTTIEAVDQFEKQYMQAVHEATSAHPPLYAGDHCSFCPAAPICPTKTGQAFAALRMDPEDLESLTESLDLVAELKTWIRDVERAGFDQLNAGATVPGWKLVAKRATTKWSDEDKTIAAMRRKLGGINGVTQRKVLSPAQMRKQAKSCGVDKWFEKTVDGLTIKSSSGNTIAPEDDKRPAVLAGEALSAALKALS